MADTPQTPKPEADDERPMDPARTGDKKHPENHQDEMSERLDEALEETFPSSDPVSVKITK
ncbi:hypothetical protein [Methylobacterium marchantiae]|uniref:Uncharacterized protein n=1 Tax=Methylobacterium marchantiae TaxID=600331 RepID=A0ABW3WVU3_9HYPH|nr:hypothetical protein AIGOOFII_1518 [Methylobacterium marchantiae]